MTNRIEQLLSEMTLEEKSVSAMDVLGPGRHCQCVLLSLCALVDLLHCCQRLTASLLCWSVYRSSVQCAARGVAIGREADSETKTAALRPLI